MLIWKKVKIPKLKNKYKRSCMKGAQKKEICRTVSGPLSETNFITNLKSLVKGKT